MATACIPQITFGFEPKGKPIVAVFDQPHASSDGGAVLLKSLDTQLQLIKRLAGCLMDTRQPGKVQHQALELRQRIFGLACGYADCNDAARLADDVARRQQAKSLELRAAMSLARLWRHRGKHVGARQVLAEVYGRFTEQAETPDLLEANGLLAELSSTG